MRNLLMTTILACAAGPLWAEQVALVLGNERYDRLDRVVEADDLADGAVALSRAGITVFSQTNADADDLRDAARDFVRERRALTGQVVALSGQFATDGDRTWFLGRDAVERPGLFGVAVQGISVDTILGILSETPGQSILLIGYESGSDDPLGERLSQGIGDMEIPQGVTVVLGKPGAIADLLEDTVARGGDVIDAVRRSRGLEALGYVPPSLVIEDPALSPMSAPPVVVDTSDEDDWRAAERLDTANAYSAYISNHPRGAYVDEARTRLQEIRDEPNRAERLAEEALGLDRDARRSIQRDLNVLNFDTRGIDGIFGPGTRRAITNWQQQNGFAQTSYLSTDQINRLDAQAERRSQELEAQAERQRRAEEARDRAFWDETGAKGDEAGLRAYLARYPDGLFSDRAEEELELVEARQRARAEARDRSAWDAAREANTVAAYSNYLQANPNGAFRDNAQARIARLREEDSGAAERQAAERGEEALRLDPLTRRLIEARLAQLGLEPGQVDGNFDRATRRAIRRFQRDREIERTGYLNGETVSRLLRG